MQESQFYIPTLNDITQVQLIENHLKNSTGVFSVSINLPSRTVCVKHTSRAKHGSIAKTLHVLGFKEVLKPVN